MLENMDQFALPIRRWIKLYVGIKKADSNDIVIRMSELNTSYSESITNMKLNSEHNEDAPNEELLLDVNINSSPETAPKNRNEDVMKLVKTPTCKPIMGKNALWARINATKAMHNGNRSDSEIVEELVNERFSTFFVNYFGKSMSRQTSRICRDLDDSQNDDDDVEFDVNTIQHSSTLNRASTYQELISVGSHATLTSKKANSVASDEKVEYDADEFMRLALGDEYFDNDYSIGTSNVSALMSKNTTYECARARNESAVIYEEGSYAYEEGTFQYDEESSQFGEPNECHESVPNKRLSDLIVECTVQNQIIQQTSKALSFCKSTKEFVASIEEVQAERILLVATTKYEAIREEIRKLPSENYYDIDGHSLGSVKISGITFPPRSRSSLMSQLFDKRKKEYTQWFVCIFACGSKIIPTQTVIANPDGLVKFDEDIFFDDLSADFELNVAVYSMIMKNNLRNYSHESKFRLNKTKSTCPSPQKLFQSHRDSKLAKQLEDQPRKSSFTLAGKCTIRISNIKQAPIYFKLSDVSTSSPLEGAVFLDISPNVIIKENHTDFLNIGTEIGEGITWNRRWCCLEGPILFHYNYPEEESPVGCLDLRNCLTAYVAAVDRAICPRPRTLFLESTISSTDRNVKKHFLSADSLPAMEVWEKKLNATLSALRNWNSMNV